MGGRQPAGRPQQQDWPNLPKFQASSPTAVRSLSCWLPEVRLSQHFWRQLILQECGMVKGGRGARAHFWEPGGFFAAQAPGGGRGAKLAPLSSHLLVPRFLPSYSHFPFRWVKLQTCPLGTNTAWLLTLTERNILQPSWAGRAVESLCLVSSVCPAQGADRKSYKLESSYTHQLHN